MTNNKGQWAVDNEKTCSHCGKGDITVHEGGRMCGCDNCHSLFRYPSMVPFPTTCEGPVNGSALWALVDYLSEVPEDVKVPGVPRIQLSEYAGKRIATWRDE